MDHIWPKIEICSRKKELLDAIAKTCASEEIVDFGLADGLADGLSELSDGAVEEPISERAYQNKSPDSQEVLVPDDFLSCMKHSTQEKETSSSAELSAADKEMITNWPKVLQQKKLCQDMAKDFPGLPQSAKKLAARKGWT